MAQIEADEYTFDVYVDDDVFRFNEYVHVTSDFVPEELKEDCGSYKDEEYVQKEYFTQEVLEGYKERLLAKIKETDAKDLFRIFCTDMDAYDIDEEKVFHGWKKITSFELVEHIVPKGSCGTGYSEPDRWLVRTDDGGAKLVIIDVWYQSEDGIRKEFEMAIKKAFGNSISNMWEAYNMYYDFKFGPRRGN